MPFAGSSCISSFLVTNAITLSSVVIPPAYHIARGYDGRISFSVDTSCLFSGDLCDPTLSCRRNFNTRCLSAIRPGDPPLDSPHVDRRAVFL